MTSRVYIGQVVHARAVPVTNAFEYPVCMYAFDLDELHVLDEKVPWFGHNRRSLVSIYDRDYLSWGTSPIRSKVQEVLERHGIHERPHRIMLVTCPKIAGWVFNPVSFYYCYDEFGKAFAYIAEINNTFEERTVYAFPAPLGETRFNVRKHFHVSPFYDMEGDYHVSFGELGDKFDISFNLHRVGEKPFVARVWGSAVPIEAGTHRGVVLRNMSRILMVLPRIYVQAMRLSIVKRLSVFKKPNPEGPMTTIRAMPCTWFDQACMWLIKRTLNRIAIGQLRVMYPDGRTEYFGDSSSDKIAEIHLHNYRIYWRVLKGGGIGFGESYTDGDWSTPDLTEVMNLILNNEHVIHESKFNRFKPTRFLNWIGHELRRNSPRNSRKNISEHYDLGNKMFAEFLDETMVYSSAKFDGRNLSLKEAQLNKLNTVLEKLKIREGDKVLEIGCGWGELAAMAAESYKASVTGITLSHEQASLAKEKAQRRGVEDRVQIQIRDYREVQGQFDRVVSIEMLEAVGREYLGSFFKTIDRVLTPNGTAVLQVIAYPDKFYKSYRYRQDWIQKHIFPGSHLPSLTALCEAMTENSNLVVEHIENLSADYALTLREWRKRFNLRAKELEKLGYDARFQRAWNFYLSSCEAEFGTRWLSLYQIVLTRPNNTQFDAISIQRCEGKVPQDQEEKYLH